VSQSYWAVSREGMLRSGSGVPDLGSRGREIPSPETPTVSGVITQRMPTYGPGHDENFGIAYQGRPSWRLSGRSTQKPGVMPRTRGRAAGLGERPRLCGGGREPQGDKQSRQTKSPAGRARCIERCPAGSGRGGWKRAVSMKPPEEISGRSEE
jgi:hypothetical protein